MRPGDSVMIIQSKRAAPPPSLTRCSARHLGQLGLVIEERDPPGLLDRPGWIADMYAGWDNTGDWYTVLVGGELQRFRDDYLELT